MNTDTRYRATLPDGSTITVYRIEDDQLAIFSDVGGWRRAYGYIVRDDNGVKVLTGKDLHGPVGAIRHAPSARDMAGSLMSFLAAAGEHYRTRGMGGDKYVPRFTVEADEWCYVNDDELSLASLEIEEMVSNG